MYRMKKGIFKDDLISTMFNAKERLIKEKGIKTFRNDNITRYCKNKIELIGLYDESEY